MPTINDSQRPPWNAKRKAHEGRLKPNNDVYTTPHYRKAVRSHKARNPYCVMCMEKGIVTPVQVTDHIQPINMGGAIHDESNWQSLCHRCHNSKSGTERTAKGGRVG